MRKTPDSYTMEHIALTLCIIIFSTISEDIDISCISRYSDVSSGNPSSTTISCNAGETMVSCGITGSDNIGGTEIDSSDVCTAYDYSSSDLYAVANCCSFPTAADVTTSTVTSAVGLDVSASCPSGSQLTDCVALYVSGDPPNSIQGSYSGNEGAPTGTTSWISTSNQCNAVSNSAIIKAVARCTSVGNTAYTLTCETRAVYTNYGNFGQCPQEGYQMMSCAAFSPGGALDSYYINPNHQCLVQKDDNARQFPNAICCQLTLPECQDPATFVWEDLMASQTDKPNVVHSLSIEETTLTLTVEVEADYLGKSMADDNGYVYGTTYVIDFEDFNAHSDSIKAPGTCQNRDRDAFADPTLTWDDVWAFSETPNAGHVGTEDYLAYAPGGDWTAEMSDLCTVKYSASFTWDELMDCTNYDGSASYISTEDTGDSIVLSGTLYINVVSPYDYAADYGFYRVYQLVSQPFQIVISKTVYVLGDVGINLLTMDIIAVYKEDAENTFRLIVLTESAEYLRLSREAEGTSYAYVFDALDTSNPITSTNFATLETAETG
eukprot:153076_1